MSISKLRRMSARILENLAQWEKQEDLEMRIAARECFTCHVDLSGKVDKTVATPNKVRVPDYIELSINRRGKSGRFNSIWHFCPSCAPAGMAVALDGVLEKLK